MTGLKLILGGVVTALSLTGTALAQQAAAGDPPTIRIESDQNEFLQKEGRGFYTGNVVVTRGEARLTTKKLTGFCVASTPGGDGKQNCDDVDPLVAEGDVLYTEGCVKFRGDKAVYQTGAGVITVTGDVIVSRCDEGVMRGTEVVYNIDEGKVKVTAGNARVLSIITPKKKDPAATPPAATTPRVN